MPVSGNGEAKLRAMIRQVGQMAKAPELRQELSRNLAAEARKQVMDEFKEQRDPYGVPWAPNLRGGQILALTARLRNSIRPIANASGFTIWTNVVYGAVHNFGAIIRAKGDGWLTFRIGNRWAKVKEVIIPKRQFFPGDHLGPIWTPAFERVVTAWLRAKTGSR